jgi:hypothetical protein
MKINKLMIYLKFLGKQEQTKSQISKWREILKSTGPLSHIYGNLLNPAQSWSHDDFSFSYSFETLRYNNDKQLNKTEIEQAVTISKRSSGVFLFLVTAN